MKCPICDRDMIEGPTIDEHHLKPKMFKYKEKILIHKVCHRKIHSVLTERELLKYYHTVERLREHPEIAKFIIWVQNKDPEFYVKHDDSGSRSKKRKNRRY